MTYAITIRRQLSLMVLSHWPHVADKISNKLPNLCPSVKGLGHKFGNLLLSPFTLATCAATSLRASAASSIFRRHEGGSPTGTAYQSENGIPNDVILCSLLLLGCRLSLQPSSSSEHNMTSLGIPFSDWLAVAVGFHNTVNPLRDV